MIFKNLRGQSGGRGGGLEKHLRSLERQAEIALPGFDAQFYNRAGDLCAEAEERERALGYYGRAIDAYLGAGRYDAAGAVCRKLLRLAPSAVRARCTLAWLAIGKGLIGDAQWEVDAYVNAAVSAGQADLARKQLRLMGEATTDPRMRAVLADHLGSLQDEEGAENLLRSQDASGNTRADAESLWSRVLRAALMGPEDLRSGG